ncbi:transcriptional regulator protein [Beggiatoa sp. PS]|nr:transcriptional regulator protein [Beggiatoa sp. PS]
MNTNKLPPIHPGEILTEEFLEPMQISQQQLADETHIPIEQINQIIQGQQGITADIALRFGRYFGMFAKFWLNLQGHYELEIAEDRLSNQLKEVKPYIAPAYSMPAYS